MRLPSSLVLYVLATAGCGDDSSGADVDAPAPAGPRVIAGGGIGDGPIDGVAYVHVIDDATRAPVSGATVRVGTIEGTTDATGLFTAEGITGAQTVTVKAANYRAEVWVGANGTNLTFDLEPAALPSARSATLSGTIDLSSFTVAAGHAKFASVAYSQTDELGDPANEIATPDAMKSCNTGLQNTSPCNFTVEVRTGKIALIAPVFDVNLSTNAATLIGYAYKTGLTVAENVDQPGITLSALDIGKQQTVAVDFGSPPSGYNTVAGVVGIDLGDDGIFQVSLRTPTDASALIPKPDAFGAGSYQLVGIAKTGDTATAAQSVVLRRGLTAAPLAAGEWLGAPTGPSITRTTATFGAVAGATLHSVEYKQGNARLANITVFDGSTSITLPELISIPGGEVQVSVNALGAPGLDPTDFALDDDQDKLVQLASQPVILP